MTPTGSETSSASTGLGGTSHRKEIELRRDASAHTFTGLVTWSSDSSTKLDTVGVWQPATPSSRPITSHSSSLRQYACGCALASLRPGSPLLAAPTRRRKRSPACLTGRRHEAGRRLVPRIPGPRQLKTIVEQRTHICRVELFLVFDVEIRPDEGKVVLDPVLLRHQIDAVEVADPLRVDQRGDRPPDDAERVAFHAGPVGIEPRVAYDVGMSLALNARRAAHVLNVERRRVEEYLSHRPAIDMHLLVLLAVDLHVDHDRRKGAGDGRRRDQDLAEQFGRLGMPANCDFADIPDHRLTSVEIG